MTNNNNNLKTQNFIIETFILIIITIKNKLFSHYKYESIANNDETK